MTKVDKTPPPSAERSAPKQEAGQPAEAPRQDVDKFRDSMRRDQKRDQKKDKREDHGQSQGKAEGQPQQVSPFGGDAILRGLQGRPSGMEDGAEQLNSTARNIVDRILISDPQTSGKQEVRITLSNDVLPGTEIHMSREGDKLQVTLLTTDNNSFRFLNEQHNGLQNHLSQRLADKVTVEVNFSQTADGGGQDGRSRQQRNLYEENEET